METLLVDGAEVTVWDVGGCDKIRSLWRHYFDNTDGVVFFIDSNAQDRIASSDDSALTAAKHFRELLAEDSLNKSIPFAVACTKQDLDGALAPEAVAAAIEMDKVAKDMNAKVFGTCITETRYEGWEELMKWLVENMRASGESKSTASVVADEAKASEAEAKEDAEDKEAHRLEAYLARADIGMNAMLAKLEAVSLCEADSEEGVFDHYMHLRVAFAYLVKKGRREGIKSIMDNLKKFLAESKVTRNTFSLTITYFWAHMVWHALHSSSLEGRTLWDATQEHKDDEDETELGALFKHFLVLNPRLCQFALYQEFYSDELFLRSEKSREEFSVPDIKALPSAVTDLDALKREADEAKFDAEAHLESLKKDGMTDEEFITSFEAHTLESWSHEVRLRVIYCYLQSIGRGKEGNDKIFSELKRHDGDGFHLTETYFWLQMVDYYRQVCSDAADFATWIATLREAGFSVQKISDAASASDSSSSKASWLRKLVSTKPADDCFDLDDQLLWREFYTREVLYPESGAPAAAMVLPDKRPLPAIMSVRK